MKYRIRDILLVSSLYDSFIFEEDGRLYELLRKEYQGLNLSHSPELIQCSSGADAIEIAKEERRFDLIIATQHIDDMHSIDFAKKARDAGLNIPIVLLGYDNREMSDLINHKEINIFDKVFIWQGDFRILIGMIKYLEDLHNIEADVNNVGVQVIILIEDSVRFYSSYLPIVYTEVLKQSQSLISEGINLSHKFLRMRARPKIILCSNYEDAWKYYEKYKDSILGIISDIDFMRNGKQDPKAGIIFAKNVKDQHPDIPVLLQSNVSENEELAYSIDASFLLKDSPSLLLDLRTFMKEHFSFGDFIFKTSKGEEVGRAKNLYQLEEQLRLIPEDSLVFHASRNHFSNWLKARTEFFLAHKLRPKKVTDFNSPEDLRKLLIQSVEEFRYSRQLGVVSDFRTDTFDSKSSFARIGGGSIGGKARGLGFVNRLLTDFNIRNKFKDVDLFVPAAVVVGSDVFDHFLEENNLRDFALYCKSDQELFEKFHEAPKFPYGPLRDLQKFIEIVNEPIAVRSSSLLEDSQGQPFAGVYDTFMLPNNHPDRKVRLYQLLSMIKRIYASIYSQRSKDYIKVTSYRLEEEKMAVIIQKVLGGSHGNRYYPEFSGVARSYNFYPNPPLKSSDGIVSVAFGLGKIITEGGNSIRFCPKYPHHLLQFSSIEDTLKYNQKEFFAVNLDKLNEDDELVEDILVKKYPFYSAEEDGTLNLVASTYSHDNEAIYDGTSRQGIRLFTLAPVLKYHVFPLPEILEVLLEMGRWGMGSPVEIEFAVNLSVPRGKPKEFGLLQMRPLVISNELEELDVNNFDDKDLICRSSNVLGNGVINDIYDIVYVDIDRFDRSRSQDVALEITQMNSKLISDNKRYLLIGVGRWGTFDPWLGIPVTWEQISGANTIIESDFKDFNVAPSQGSHFFQNLTSFKVGYFTIDHEQKNFIDWNWLKNQEAVEEKNFIRHVKLKEPVLIKINGHENKGVIIKPEAVQNYNHYVDYLG
ncbi:MAG: histidine kinase [Melioribacteraceae bacterium]|nr:histidine kinase [Melioribacteraceae bacterium]MCF8356299.1 histidine kinase [Melioribacteraceae bacterium]MCF8393544.1 histidine kinase [Melioribacteraceae bacterium]MCF8419354.1 histidine kinase [Melioribacteraceae bacterium]